MYSAALIKAGFNVELASDGQEAIDKMRAVHPRLVFMDLVMPNLTGAEALAQMKQDPEIKTTPVVMLTSISAEIKGEDLLMQGAVAYLVKDDTKPEDVSKLAAELLGTADAPLDPTAA
jgi:CheY-like chemotaxis protein